MDDSWATKIEETPTVPVPPVLLNAKEDGSRKKTLNKLQGPKLREDDSECGILWTGIVKKVRHGISSLPDEASQWKSCSSSAPLFGTLGGSFGKPAMSPFGFLQLGEGFGRPLPHYREALGKKPFEPSHKQGETNGKKERCDDKSSEAAGVQKLQLQSMPRKPTTSSNEQEQNLDHMAMCQKPGPFCSKRGETISKSADVCDSSYDQVDPGSHDGTNISVCTKDEEKSFSNENEIDYHEKSGAFQVDEGPIMSELSNVLEFAVPNSECGMPGDKSRLVDSNKPAGSQMSNDHTSSQFSEASTHGCTGFTSEIPVHTDKELGHIGSEFSFAGTEKETISSGRGDENSTSEGEFHTRISNDGPKSTGGSNTAEMPKRCVEATRSSTVGTASSFDTVDNARQDRKGNSIVGRPEPDVVEGELQLSCIATDVDTNMGASSLDSQGTLQSKESVHDDGSASVMQSQEQGERNYSTANPCLLATLSQEDGDLEEVVKIEHQGFGTEDINSDKSDAGEENSFEITKKTSQTGEEKNCSPADPCSLATLSEEDGDSEEVEEIQHQGSGTEDTQSDKSEAGKENSFQITTAGKTSQTGEERDNSPADPRLLQVLSQESCDQDYCDATEDMVAERLETKEDTRPKEFLAGQENSLDRCSGTNKHSDGCQEDEEGELQKLVTSPVKSPAKELKVAAASLAGLRDAFVDGPSSAINDADCHSTVGITPSFHHVDSNESTQHRAEEDKNGPSADTSVQVALSGENASHDTLKETEIMMIQGLETENYVNLKEIGESNVSEKNLYEDTSIENTSSGNNVPKCNWQEEELQTSVPSVTDHPSTDSSVSGVLFCDTQESTPDKGAFHHVDNSDAMRSHLREVKHSSPIVPSSLAALAQKSALHENLEETNAMKNQKANTEGNFLREEILADKKSSSQDTFSVGNIEECADEPSKGDRGGPVNIQASLRQDIVAVDLVTKTTSGHRMDSNENDDAFTPVLFHSSPESSVSSSTEAQVNVLLNMIQGLPKTEEVPKFNRNYSSARLDSSNTSPGASNHATRENLLPSVSSPERKSSLSPGNPVQSSPSLRQPIPCSPEKVLFLPTRNSFGDSDESFQVQLKTLPFSPQGPLWNRANNSPNVASSDDCDHTDYIHQHETPGRNNLHQKGDRKMEACLEPSFIASRCHQVDQKNSPSPVDVDTPEPQVGPQIAARTWERECTASIKLCSTSARKRGDQEYIESRSFGRNKPLETIPHRIQTNLLSSTPLNAISSVSRDNSFMVQRTQGHIDGLMESCFNESVISSDSQVQTELPIVRLDASGGENLRNRRLLDPTSEANESCSVETVASLDSQTQMELKPSSPDKGIDDSMKGSCFEEPDDTQQTNSKTGTELTLNCGISQRANMRDYGNIHRCTPKTESPAILFEVHIDEDCGNTRLGESSEGVAKTTTTHLQATFDYLSEGEASQSMHRRKCSTVTYPVCFSSNSHELQQRRTELIQTIGDMGDRVALSPEGESVHVGQTNSAPEEGNPSVTCERNFEQEGTSCSKDSNQWPWLLKIKRQPNPDAPDANSWRLLTYKKGAPKLVESNKASSDEYPEVTMIADLDALEPPSGREDNATSVADLHVSEPSSVVQTSCTSDDCTSDDGNITSVFLEERIHHKDLGRVQATCQSPSEQAKGTLAERSVAKLGRCEQSRKVVEHLPALGRVILDQSEWNLETPAEESVAKLDRCKKSKEGEKRSQATDSEIPDQRELNSTITGNTVVDSCNSDGPNKLPASSRTSRSTGSPAASRTSSISPNPAELVVRKLGCPYSIGEEVDELTTEVFAGKTEDILGTERNLFEIFSSPFSPGRGSEVGPHCSRDNSEDSSQEMDGRKPPEGIELDSVKGNAAEKKTYKNTKNISQVVDERNPHHGMQLDPVKMSAKKREMYRNPKNSSQGVDERDPHQRMQLNPVKTDSKKRKLYKNLENGSQEVNEPHPERQLNPVKTNAKRRKTYENPENGSQGVDEREPHPGMQLNSVKTNFKKGKTYKRQHGKDKRQQEQGTGDPIVITETDVVIVEIVSGGNGNHSCSTRNDRLVGHVDVEEVIRPRKSIHTGDVAAHIDVLETPNKSGLDASEISSYLPRLLRSQWELRQSVCGGGARKSNLSQLDREGSLGREKQTWECPSKMLTNLEFTDSSNKSIESQNEMQLTELMSGSSSVARTEIASDGMEELIKSKAYPRKCAKRGMSSAPKSLTYSPMLLRSRLHRKPIQESTDTRRMKRKCLNSLANPPANKCRLMEPGDVKLGSAVRPCEVVLDRLLAAEVCIRAEQGPSTDEIGTTGTNGTLDLELDRLGLPEGQEGEDEEVSSRSSYLPSRGSPPVSLRRIRKRLLEQSMKNPNLEGRQSCLTKQSGVETDDEEDYHVTACRRKVEGNKEGVGVSATACPGKPNTGRKTGGNRKTDRNRRISTNLKWELRSSHNRTDDQVINPTKTGLELEGAVDCQNHRKLQGMMEDEMSDKLAGSDLSEDQENQIEKHEDVDHQMELNKRIHTDGTPRGRITPNCRQSRKAGDVPYEEFFCIQQTENDQVDNLSMGNAEENSETIVNGEVPNVPELRDKSGKTTPRVSQSQDLSPSVCKLGNDHVNVSVPTQGVRELTSTQRRQEDTHGMERADADVNPEKETRCSSSHHMDDREDTDLSCNEINPEGMEEMFPCEDTKQCRSNVGPIMKSAGESKEDMESLYPGIRRCSASVNDDALDGSPTRHWSPDAGWERFGAGDSRGMDDGAISQTGTNEGASVSCDETGSELGEIRDSSMHDANEPFVDEDCISLKAGSHDFFNESGELDETVHQRHIQSDDSDVSSDGELPEDEDTPENAYHQEPPVHTDGTSSKQSSLLPGTTISSSESLQDPHHTLDVSPQISEKQSHEYPEGQESSFSTQCLPIDHSGVVSCTPEEPGLLTLEETVGPPAVTRKFSRDVPIIQFGGNSLPGLPDGVTGVPKLAPLVEPVTLDHGSTSRPPNTVKMIHRIPSGYCFQFAEQGKCTWNGCKFNHVLLRDIPSFELKAASFAYVPNKDEVERSSDVPPPVSLLEIPWMDTPLGITQDDKQRVMGSRSPPPHCILPPPNNQGIFKPPILPLPLRPPPRISHPLPVPLIPAFGPRFGVPSAEIQSATRRSRSHKQAIPSYCPTRMTDYNHRHGADAKETDIDCHNLPGMEVPSKRSFKPNVPQLKSWSDLLREHKQDRDMPRPMPDANRAHMEPVTEHCPSSSDGIHRISPRIGRSKVGPSETTRVSAVDPLGRARWLLKRNCVTDAWNEYRLKTRQNGVLHSRELLLEIIAALPRKVSASRWKDCKEALLELSISFSEDTTESVLEVLHQLNLLHQEEADGKDIPPVAVSIFQECVPAQNTVQEENPILSTLSGHLLQDPHWSLLHCFVSSQAEKGFTPSLESIENAVFKYCILNNHLKDLMELMRLLDGLKFKLPVGFYDSVKQYLETSSRLEDIHTILTMKGRYYSLDLLERNFIASQQSGPSQPLEMDKMKGVDLIPARDHINLIIIPEEDEQDPTRKRICSIIKKASNIKTLGKVFLTIYSEDRTHFSEEVIQRCFALTITSFSTESCGHLYREFVQSVRNDPVLQPDGSLYLAHIGRSLFLSLWAAQDAEEALRVLEVLTESGMSLIPKVFVNLSPEASRRGEHPFREFLHVIMCLIKFGRPRRAYSILRGLNNNDWDHHFWSVTCCVRSWLNCYLILAEDLMAQGYLDECLGILIRVGEYHSKHNKIPEKQQLLREPLNRLLSQAFESQDLNFLHNKVLPAIKGFSELSRENTHRMVTESVVRDDMHTAREILLMGIQNGSYLAPFFNDDRHEGRIRAIYTLEEMYIAVCEFFHQSDLIISELTQQGGADTEAAGQIIDRLSFRILITAIGTRYEKSEPGLVARVMEDAKRLVIEQISRLVPDLDCKVAGVSPRERLIFISRKNIRDRYMSIHPCHDGLYSKNETYG